MKSTNRKKGVITASLSALLLIASAVAFFVFYYLTRYLPFYLMALLVLLPTVIYTILLLIGFLRAPAEEGSESVPDCPAEGSDGDEPTLTDREKRRRLRLMAGRSFKALACALQSFLYHRRVWLIVLPTAAAMALTHWLFWLMTGRMTSVYNIGYVVPVALLLFFILYVIFDKWCKYAESDSEYMTAVIRNLRAALGVTRLSVLLTLVIVVVRLLGFYELQKWLMVAMCVIFVYESVFLLLSLGVRALRRELTEKPDLSIPMPQLLGNARELGVLSYLEENTGITMRSLWSIKFIKMLLPYTVLFACLILWISTGLIQIESYQHGAVYRFGQLQEDELQPGLHLTMPWPIDRVEVYNTDTVRKVTIGYKSTEAKDNIWTENHGNSEYKLLLGSGDEVISINLRLEYRIHDLVDYLRSSAAPEKLLEAKAYELVIDHTINADLETLLAVDRSAFAADFHSDLNATIEPYHTGLEVVSVVLESIHPPVEIASVYQGVISAEIQAQRQILEAEAKAAVTLAEAQSSYDTAISVASSTQYTQVAQARADVAEFMASVSADHAYSDAYRYYKYLNAIGRAYGQARLVIVGEGVKSSNLYFGSMVLN